MLDKIVMQLHFLNGTKVEIIDPIINVKSPAGGVGNIEGELSGPIWTGEVHLWCKGKMKFMYDATLVEVRLFSDGTDFAELCEDIPQIPIDGFSYEAYYKNLKNIKERFEAFSVLVEEHKKGKVA